MDKHQQEINYYGYIRVSTKGKDKDGKDKQNKARQYNAIEEYERVNNVKLKIFCDEKSGKDFDRVHYKALKEVAQNGDVIVVKELDRFGRNYEEIFNELAYFRTKGIKIVILDLPILEVKDETLSSLLTNLMLELLSYVAQKEREKIVMRVREGVDNALAKGTKSGRPFGRPPAELPKDFEKYYDMVMSKKVNRIEMAKLLGVDRITIYRWIKQYESRG